ncbi:MAG: cation-translocating P-type ATPase [bacterium]
MKEFFKKSIIKSSHIWHNMSVDSVLRELKSHKDGLDENEAEKRLKKNGENKLPEEKNRSKFAIFFMQFRNPLIYVLLIAAVISLFLEKYADAIVIIVAVIINTFIGYIEESKADSALLKIKRLIKQNVKVLRKEKNKIREIEIDSVWLVPGDIIILSSGDKVPADARIIEENELKINEASLTGESMPVEKSIEKLKKGANLAERTNMCYMGTTVMSGNGRAIVCMTGRETELGNIAKMVNETKDEKTPLQEKIVKFSKMLSVLVFILCLLILNVGILRGFNCLEIFLTSVAIAVAAIPEGLVISVTVILALGMQRILKKNALVKKLVAAETLGSASVICMDKTGTLTEGRMALSHIVVEELKNGHDASKNGFKNLSQDVSFALKIGMLCNNTIVENKNDELHNWVMHGDSTETALYLAAVQAGFEKEKLEEMQPKIKEIPFNEERKYMATIHKKNRENDSLPLSYIAYIKGAPEILIEKLDKIKSDNRIIYIDDDKKKEIKKQYEELSSKGLRVIAVGYKEISKKVYEETLNKEDLIDKIIFVGFMGLKDPLRKDAKETVFACLAAGINPIIITGDHRLTAKAIMEEVGIPVDSDNILEGDKLDKMSDEELKKVIKKIKIYARVSPRHKLRVVDAWQRGGEVVAMTGDGVNDAPAIKSADIGIALGSGTDVAKETADIILLDDSFKTIVDIIKEGRIIFDNIRKIILYLLSDSFSEMILIVGSLFFSLPLPVLPVQILWINLVTDGFPGIAMAMEPGETEVEKEKPRLKSEPLMNFEMKILIFIISIITSSILFFVYLYLLRINLDLKYLRTLIFGLLGTDSLIYAFSCRSLRKPIWKTNIFNNKYLILAVVFGFALQIIPIYFPPLQKLLHLAPLSIKDWIIIIIFGIINIIMIEICKSFFINGKRNV